MPEVDGWDLFTPLSNDRKVFARGFDHLRVISARTSFLHDVSDLESPSGLSEIEQRHVARVAPEGGDVTRVSVENDLDDQLEALGYE